MAQKAIKAIGIIALQLPSLANMCVDKLLSLLVMEIDHITSEVMVTMTSEHKQCTVYSFYCHFFEENVLYTIHC